nr:LCP family protein [Corynebacterium lactis]
MEGNFDDARIARDRYGRPLKDRYGRPIYRRVDGDSPARPNPPQNPASRRPLPPRQDPQPRPQEQSRQGTSAYSGNPSSPGPRQRQDLPGRGARREPMNETRIQQIPPSYRRDRQDAGRSRATGDDPRFPPRGYNPDADYGHGYGEPRNQSYQQGGYPPQGNQAGQGTPDDRGGRGGRGGRFGGRIPKPQRPNFRMPRMRFKTIALIIILVLVATMAIVDLRLTRVDAFGNLENRPSNTMASNWLLVGSDSRAGLTEEQANQLSTGSGDFGQRTDTIMIAHIPLVGKPKLVSIPRDSFVDIAGNDKNKINAAFAFGGPQLLIDTVEKNTGIHIDHYAEIGFGGFAGIVDAVGGVELCPTEPINDPLAGLDMQPGCQTFDGKTALGYVRTRATAQGDLDRVQRQREFMGALMGRITSPWVWLNPYRMIRLMGAGTKAVFVGDGDHVWHLTWLLGRMALGSDSLTVPTAGAMDTGYAGNVLLWDEQAAPAMFEELK